jgi:hypothetical protein
MTGCFCCNFVSDTNDAATDDSAAQSAPVCKEADYLGVSALCECPTRLAEFQRLEFDATHGKAPATQLIETNADRNQVSPWFVWRKGKSGGLCKGFDVLRLNQRQLIVSRSTVLGLHVPISLEPNVRNRLNLGQTPHRRAALGSYKDVLHGAHRGGANPSPIAAAHG